MLRVLKGGNNLSFRAVKPSTLGERELNFCVRDGNRWNLSSIVTAMVYETLPGIHIKIITARLSPKRLYQRFAFPRNLSPQADN